MLLQRSLRKRKAEPCSSLASSEKRSKNLISLCRGDAAALIEALGDEQPKYLNSPRTPIFDKSTLVYGLDHAREAARKSDQVVIVEGYMDVIAAHQFGYENVVAAMGHRLDRIAGRGS